MFGAWKCTEIIDVYVEMCAAKSIEMIDWLMCGSISIIAH